MDEVSSAVEFAFNYRRRCRTQSRDVPDIWLGDGPVEAKARQKYPDYAEGDWRNAWT